MSRSAFINGRCRKLGGGGTCLILRVQSTLIVLLRAGQMGCGCVVLSKSAHRVSGEGGQVELLPVGTVRGVCAAEQKATQKHKDERQGRLHEAVPLKWEEKVLSAFLLIISFPLSFPFLAGFSH
jgi:hypothetical protein